MAAKAMIELSPLAVSRAPSENDMKQDGGRAEHTKWELKAVIQRSKDIRYIPKNPNSNISFFQAKIIDSHNHLE